jgi:hypothetical protein
MAATATHRLLAAPAVNDRPRSDLRALLAEPQVSDTEWGWLVAFGDGRVATIERRPQAVTVVVRSPAGDVVAEMRRTELVHAIEAARWAGVALPRPWGESTAALEASLGCSVAAAESGSRNDFCAMLRKVLRVRFPRVRIRVRGSRGTGYGWIHVDGADSVASGLLAMIRLCTISPSGGSRGAALCLAAGVPRPIGWRIAERSWD